MPCSNLQASTLQFSTVLMLDKYVFFYISDTTQLKDISGPFFLHHSHEIDSIHNSSTSIIAL